MTTLTRKIITTGSWHGTTERMTSSSNNRCPVSQEPHGILTPHHAIEQRRTMCDHDQQLNDCISSSSSITECDVTSCALIVWRQWGVTWMHRLTMKRRYCFFTHTETHIGSIGNDRWATNSCATESSPENISCCVHVFWSAFYRTKIYCSLCDESSYYSAVFR